VPSVTVVKICRLTQGIWDTQQLIFSFLDPADCPSNPLTGQYQLATTLTRLLRQRGATHVVGVDLSAGMIDLARRQEAQQPLGITYRVRDARQLPFRAEYDLVVAAYLLNYARNRVELRTMCEGIARSLKPGGRFVTVNSNPALDFSTAPSFRRYGFETRTVRPFQEGSPITWTFFLEERSFSIENYFLDIDVHEEVLRAAGFREIRWHPPRLSSEGQAVYGADFWKTFLEHPPVTFLECQI
jgi:SAM-dependent methyltransferase